MNERLTARFRAIYRLDERRSAVRLLLGIGMLAAGGAALAVEGGPAYVAGMTPDSRRGDAPVIKEAPPFDEKRTFRGIEQPHPGSLNVFKDQGSWHTPFTLPGMTAPYDIRGYHRQ